MSFELKGINLFDKGLDNEFRINFLEAIVEKILLKNPDLLSRKQINQLRKNAIKQLQDKYPEAGIELIEKQNLTKKRTKK